MGNSVPGDTTLKCTGDYLEISVDDDDDDDVGSMEGSSEGSSTQRYCGTTIPAKLTTTNTITVKLHLVEGDVSGAGFLATACCSLDVTTDDSTGEK